jgi:hypothetical protein
MREITVIAGTDGEDADDIEAQANPQRRRAHASPNRGEGREVKEHERNGRGIEDIVVEPSGICLMRHEWPCVFLCIAAAGPASHEALGRLARTAMDLIADSLD